MDQLWSALKVTVHALSFEMKTFMYTHILGFGAQMDQPSTRGMILFSGFSGCLAHDAEFRVSGNFGCLAHDAEFVPFEANTNLLIPKP